MIIFYTQFVNIKLIQLWQMHISHESFNLVHGCLKPKWASVCGVCRMYLGKNQLNQLFTFECESEVLPDKEKDPDNNLWNFLRTGFVWFFFKLGHFKFTKNNFSRTIFVITLSWPQGVDTHAESHDHATIVCGNTSILRKDKCWNTITFIENRKLNSRNINFCEWLLWKQIN